jgi:hypothetical protein
MPQQNKRVILRNEYQSDNVGVKRLLLQSRVYQDCLIDMQDDMIAMMHHDHLMVTMPNLMSLLSHFSNKDHLAHLVAVYDACKGVTFINQHSSFQSMNVMVVIVVINKEGELQVYQL